MKFFTLSTLLLLATYTSFAQAIITAPNDSSYVSSTITDAFENTDIHIGLINNSGGAVEFTWLMKDYIAPQAWEVKCCDNNNCYDLLINPGPYASLSVPAGDTMDMKFQFTSHCVDGMGNANLVVYLDGDSANTAVAINYKTDVTANCASSIGNVKSLEIGLFPNPVVNQLQITGLNSSNYNYQVINSTGSVLKQGVTTNAQPLDVQALSNGVYQLIVFEGKTLIGSQRFSKID